ncbi:hypothetical protein LEM8419_00502 [Neolewinella maritima]|uniref:HTH araC/xylS-type domain-containing protein n=1 Tax=Neolewinella maritima TaxID=1383882 RepID=A0ABM9AX33_9BACT|nr:helix-turn-helix transcriptional regulator [Neolewinella maritima]CAH0999205.1 hypothetical protein LEM8419_00502 [Neolewinella maritima]
MHDKQHVYIDNMVCSRCKLVVRQVADTLGWRIERIELGLLSGWPPDGDDDILSKLSQQLGSLGFRIREGQGGVVSRIKGLIVSYVYDDRADTSRSLSDLISADIGQSYSHLSRMFSREEGRTIVEFYRLHRMERGKQLLTQTHAPVSEIARKLNYGSAGRFTAVFKQDTGLSPTAFRARGYYTPRPLDEL